METCSRRIVGWSIDTVQDSQLVTNDLDMAISQRTVRNGGIVRADHGVQFTSWAFTENVRSAGLMPSFGSVGDTLDNAMMEPFWSSMQNELLDRKRWTTRIELINDMFDYIEVFCNRRRRHSKLGYVSPIEYERTLDQEAALLNTIAGNQACSRSNMSPNRAAVPNDSETRRASVNAALTSP